MAISVSPESLMGGILVPGDHVDILVSYQLEKEVTAEPSKESNDPQAAIGDMMNAVMSSLGSAGGSVPSQWVTEDVLIDVRIIAIGSALSGSRQAQMFGVSGGSGRSSTVTLELTPTQARELVRVQANGRNPLTLLLRPEDTSDESATSSLTGG
jgi:Flp pilus assembly protein CpaB